MSYLFGLRGPSVSIDTACSSSLVAAHYAAGDIQNGKVDASVAAGVSLTFNSFETAAFRITGGAVVRVVHAGLFGPRQCIP